ncbi:pyruvate-flavodoxin oxidoreductase-related [Anaeramoeba flamelloides]|uniref:pyruvate dehydrogenase (NADP(+)) n=1 Tax=Anaeramoeba flamelloides TaxID=1746091 RepID=A0AAV7ZZ28_9EUKA|nr:pyruvate-flavodoxin oxidoreductase-related [Anaeramoeba flamelloides]
MFNIARQHNFKSSFFPAKSLILRLASKSKSVEPMDGNLAAAYIGYALSDTAFIYPITPSSPMGEVVDEWSARGIKNVFGQPVDVTEMQSEGGAAGAVHGSCSAGSLTSTYTASQGLLLMLPNMYKIAGEMMPCVFHVAARALAGQALSIFGDHADVMACRTAGFALLSSGNPQEAMDLALVAHLASIKSRLPFVHFFEGFRVSHEINSVDKIPYDKIKELIDQKQVEKIRKAAMNPEFPHMRGSSQGPDVYFQIVEAANQYYDVLPKYVKESMEEVERITGRSYKLFDYTGPKDAKNVIVVLGSGGGVCEELVNKMGEELSLGVIKVRLYRPFVVEDFVNTLPNTVERIAVLDRTKEPGSVGEPLYLDVVTALDQVNLRDKMTIVGGRYGLGSKDFTPAMVKSVYDNLVLHKPKNGFTIGITDDVTNTSLEVGEPINCVPEGTQQCMFWGLGSDGTVGANKNAIKIIVDNTDLYGQGYFAYSAHKSGGLTMSHLRFGPNPINSPYLITHANYVACHCPLYVTKYDLLKPAKQDAIFVLNCPWETVEELDKNLPGSLKRRIVEKNVDFYVINASKIAEEVGLIGRINMIMQSVFFKLSKVLPEKQAFELLKKAIKKSYKKFGQDIVDKNIQMVDMGITKYKRISYPESWKDAELEEPEDLSVYPEFVRDVVKPMSSLKGDDIPVSKFPVGGFLPLGTSQYDKRGVAPKVPKWEPKNCIQCNLCSFVCPHGTIRPFLYDEEADKNSSESFVGLDAVGVKGRKDLKFRMQVTPLDCQGCGLCANICPQNCLEMIPIEESKKTEIDNWEYALTLPSYAHLFKRENVKGSQFYKPLLEFSGACAGCGETPYIKLITQLYGEQMMIANATGCSSIWGLSYPNTPYCKNEEGHGPTWGNSLFEDNAEYGLGMAKASKHQRRQLRLLVDEALECETLPKEVRDLFSKWEENMWDLRESKKLADQIKVAIKPYKEECELMKKIWTKRDLFAKKCQFIIGGDGWAFDIGYGGLDHALASGEDINVIVLDTETYSNTGGQASKATPRSSVAKFTYNGKPTKKKDLGMMAMTYGDVYVASVSLSNLNHLVKTIKEAVEYPGPSLIITYSHCIAHGTKGGLTTGIETQNLGVKVGYWPLYRYNPVNKKKGKNPFSLDSKKPKIEGLFDFLDKQARYRSLKSSFPEQAKLKQQQLKEDILDRYNGYVRLANAYKKKK